jgi:hypothetical protein
MGPEPDEEEKRRNLIRLVFRGDESRLEAFRDLVKVSVPEAEAAVVRGSAITGRRWKDRAPFDADGPGTSDIDLTLVGGDVLRYFTVDGYWIPGVHSRPLSDDDPDIAPDLTPLRRKLVEMAGRPVNIQGTRDWVQFLRGDVFGQPYLTLFGNVG